MLKKRHLLAVSALILEVALMVYTTNGIQSVEAEDKSIGITCRGNKPCEQTVCVSDKPCQKSTTNSTNIELNQTHNELSTEG
jgi:hypothetical protein